MRDALSRSASCRVSVHILDEPASSYKVRRCNNVSPRLELTDSLNSYSGSPTAFSGVPCACALRRQQTLQGSGL